MENRTALGQKTIELARLEMDFRRQNAGQGGVHWRHWGLFLGGEPLHSELNCLVSLYLEGMGVVVMVVLRPHNTARKLIMTIQAARSTNWERWLKFQRITYLISE